MPPPRSPKLTHISSHFVPAQIQLHPPSTPLSSMSVIPSRQDIINIFSTSNYQFEDHEDATKLSKCLALYKGQPPSRMSLSGNHREYGCSDPDCAYKLRVIRSRSKNKDSLKWEISKYEPHTCDDIEVLHWDKLRLDRKDRVESMTFGANYLAKYLLIATQGRRRTLELSQAQQIIHQHFSVLIQPAEYFRLAVQEYNALIQVEPVNQWQKIPAYIQRLKSDDEKAVAKLDVDSDGVIHRVFVAPSHSLAKVTNGLGTLCLDATFPKGHDEFIVYLATTQSASRATHLVAWMLGGPESTESWSFFLDGLLELLKQDEDPAVLSLRLSFLSDQHSGLLAAFNSHPALHYYNCSYHIARNCYARVKIAGGGAKDAKWLVLKAASAGNKPVADEYLELISEFFPAVYKRLDQIPRESWMISYSDTFRAGIVTTNSVEGVNSALTKTTRTSWLRAEGATGSANVRHAGPLDALAGLQGYSRDKDSEAVDEYKNGMDLSSVPPWLKQELNLLGRATAGVAVTHADGATNGIVPGTSGTWSVDLLTQSCSCGNWKARGYPCRHAIPLIKAAGHLVPKGTRNPENRHWIRKCWHSQHVYFMSNPALSVPITATANLKVDTSIKGGPKLVANVACKRGTRGDRGLSRLDFATIAARIKAATISGIHDSAGRFKSTRSLPGAADLVENLPDGGDGTANDADLEQLNADAQDAFEKAWRESAIPMDSLHDDEEEDLSQIRRIRKRHGSRQSGREAATQASAAHGRKSGSGSQITPSSLPAAPMKPKPPHKRPCATSTNPDGKKDTPYYPPVNKEPEEDVEQPRLPKRARTKTPKAAAAAKTQLESELSRMVAVATPEVLQLLLDTLKKGQK